MEKIKKIFNNFSKLDFSVLITILIIAAFYRLYRIADYMTFLGDEGRDVLKVYEILHGQLTLLGPTSSVGGFFLGSIYYYFMAPFLLLFNYDPVGPAVMVALFGVATVFLIYYISSKLFNRKVAFFASILYAISPLVVAYSRSSWNPNPLPFFSLLCLYILHEATVKENKKLFFASGILLGICLQLHYLALFLSGVVFLYILFTSLFKDFTRKAIIEVCIKYIVYFFGFLLGWSFFIAFEIRHNFLNIKNIFNFVINSEDTGAGSSFVNIIGDVFFRIFARTIFAYPANDQLQWFSKEALGLWTVSALIVGIASISVLIIYFYRSLKIKDNNFYKYSLLFIWFLVGVLLFGFYKKSIYDYYFTFLFPLPFILFGIFLNSLLDIKFKKSFFIKLFIVIFFIILIGLNLRGIPFRYQPNRQLNQMKTIADFVMTRTDAKPFNFALITGGNSDHAYRYFFTIWNNPPVTIDEPAKDPERKTVTDQLFVVCESLPCQPLGNSLWEIAGFGRAEIAGKWNVSVVEIYKLVPYKGE